MRAGEPASLPTNRPRTSPKDAKPGLMDWVFSERTRQRKAQPVAAKLGGGALH